MDAEGESNEPTVAVNDDSGDQTPADPVDALRVQHQQYSAWITQFINSNAQAGEQLAPASGTASIPELVSAMASASSAQGHLTYLKYWAETVRELERRQQEVSPLAPSAGLGQTPVLRDADAYAAAGQAALDALGLALQAGDYAASYAQGLAGGSLQQLMTIAATIDARMQESRYTLYSRFLQDAQEVLALMGWPPPLSTTTTTTAAADVMPHPDLAPPNGASAEAAAAGVQQPAELSVGGGPGADPARHFVGWEAQPALLPTLLLVLRLLTQLQQLVERSAFARLGQEVAAEGGQAEEEPLLWAATTLVAPLQARLLAQFDPCMPAGRLDQPGWMFQLVLRLTQEHVGCMAALQPLVVACGLASHYHMGVEWARALRDAAKAVLRIARLPALHELQESEDSASYWEAHVQAALQFESQMAPFLGAAIAQGRAEALPDALLLGSVLGAITEERTHFDAWMSVEKNTVLAKLGRAVDDDAAWESSVDDDDEDGLVTGFAGQAKIGAVAGSKASDLEAAGRGWRREFNPPRIAEAAAATLTMVFDRSKHLPTASTQQEYLQEVAGALLKCVQDLLTATLEQAVQLRSTLTLRQAVRVGACVSAARFLHHQLSELLESPFISRLAAAAAAAAAAGPTHGASPVAAVGSAAHQGLGGSSPEAQQLLAPHVANVSKGALLLGSHLAQLSALHREGCLRIAREIALGFGRAAVGYRKAVESAAQYPTHEAAAGTVTPALLPALTFMQSALRSLSHPLDAPSFQDIWRALAVPVNRFLFNYVVTEAHFTQQGAQQFAVDCSGLLAVFSEFCKRPEAHFKEVLAAARLLTLPEEYTPAVVRLASAQQVLGQPLWKEPYLVSIKVSCLSAQQVVAVLERRL
ncbi:TIP-1 family-domain-containing protein [Haematococcus lacustris]